MLTCLRVVSLSRRTISTSVSGVVPRSKTKDGSQCFLNVGSRVAIIRCNADDPDKKIVASGGDGQLVAVVGLTSHGLGLVSEETDVYRVVPESVPPSGGKVRQ